MKLSASLIAIAAIITSASALNFVPLVNLTELAITKLPIAQASPVQRYASAPVCTKALLFFAIFSAQPAGSDCNLREQG